MGSDPFPKIVENAAGDRLMVNTLHEQDAATKRGYFRSIARNREFAEQQEAEKKADV